MLEEDRQRIIREFVQKLTDLGEEGEQVNLIDMVFAAHPELPDDLRSQLSVLQGALTNSSTTRTQTGSSSSTDSPALIPGYHVLHELHRGGQAIVYQAVQQSTKRKVAIKILLDGKHASPAARRRFEREVELVAQLKHPNIISIFDSGRTDDGYDYCIMDYIRGVPLTQFARNNKLALEDRLKLLATVCDAVKYAHQKGVIHRDLKPSNILVDSEGVPQVLDFGLAKQLTDSTDSMLSLTGQVVGTLPYMSPEQTTGNPDLIDIRTDVYALGVILYELLTGHFPYQVVGPLADVLRQITEEPPIPPIKNWDSDSGVSKRNTKTLRIGDCPIDSDVQTISLKALAKDRERRYQTAGDLGRDLQNYLSRRPLDARRESASYLIRCFMRRHRRTLSLYVASSIGALGLIIGSIFAISAEQQSLAADIREKAKTLLAAAARSEFSEQERKDLQAYLVSICERARNKQATPLELDALHSVLVNPSVSGPPMVKVDDLEKFSLGLFRSTHEWDLEAHMTGLGVLIEPMLLCDGKRVNVHALDSIAVDFDSHSTNYLLCNLGEQSLGEHIITGGIHVQLIKLLSEERTIADPIPGTHYEGLSSTTSFLPISRREFMVVSSYPQNFPLKINDEPSSYRLETDLVVESSSLRKYGDGRSELSLNFSVPDLNFRLCCNVAIVSPDYGYIDEFDLQTSSNHGQVMYTRSGIGGRKENGKWFLGLTVSPEHSEALALLKPGAPIILRFKDSRKRAMWNGRPYLAVSFDHEFTVNEVIDRTN